MTTLKQKIESVIAKGRRHGYQNGTIASDVLAAIAEHFEAQGQQAVAVPKDAEHDMLQRAFS